MSWHYISSRRNTFLSLGLGTYRCSGSFSYGKHARSRKETFLFNKENLACVRVSCTFVGTGRSGATGKGFLCVLQTDPGLPLCVLQTPPAYQDQADLGLGRQGEQVLLHSFLGSRGVEWQGKVPCVFLRLGWTWSGEHLGRRGFSLHSPHFLPFLYPSAFTWREGDLGLEHLYTPSLSRICCTGDFLVISCGKKWMSVYGLYY